MKKKKLPPPTPLSLFVGDCHPQRSWSADRRSISPTHALTKVAWRLAGGRQFSRRWKLQLFVNKMPVSRCHPEDNPWCSWLVRPGDRPYGRASSGLSPHRSNCLGLTIKSSLFFCPPLLFPPPSFLFFPSYCPPSSSSRSFSPSSFSSFSPSSLPFSSIIPTLSSSISPFSISIFTDLHSFPPPAHKSLLDQLVLLLSHFYLPKRDWKSSSIIHKMLRHPPINSAFGIYFNSMKYIFRLA